MGDSRLRVVQWATGNIGMWSLRAVIEHPDMDLVGLYVYSGSKVGRDAGELCGLGPVGVTATSDVEEILALRPDGVLYMGDRPDIDVICRLLGSGASVVSTRSEFHRPASIDPAIRARLEEACREGGSTLHSTGSSPGFISEAVPLVLSSVERRIERIVIDEYADMSSRNSPEMIFGLMGFGRDPSSFDPTMAETHAAKSYRGSLGVVADAVGLPLDGVEAHAQVAVARKAFEVAAGGVEAGKVAGQRLEVTGTRQGRPFITFRSNWYLSSDLDPDWILRETGWHLTVEGDVPLDVDIRFPVPDEEWGEVSPGVTANRPVNVLPYVCAAPPGIVTTADLPMVLPHLT